MKPKELERSIESKILHYLNMTGWFAFKVGNVGVFDEKANAYRKPGRFQVNGISDVIAIKESQVLFIEVKRENGKQSEAQIAFQSAIERHGGKYLLVKSLDELKENLER